MNIACSTAIGTRRPLPDALARIAQLGFEAIELMCFPGWAHVEPAELAEGGQAKVTELQEALSAHSLRAVALNGEPSGEINTFFPMTHAQNLKEAVALCELARALEARVVTVPAGAELPGLSFEDSFQLSIQNLRDWAAIGADRDVRVAIETHVGSLAERPDNTLRLLEQVDDLWITYDPSHYVAAGIPLSEGEPLLCRIAHCHLRNARVGCFQERMDRGLLDIDGVLRTLQKHHYEGWIAIEYIEDLARQEGYDVEAEVVALKERLEAAAAP